MEIPYEKKVKVGGVEYYTDLKYIYVKEFFKDINTYIKDNPNKIEIQMEDIPFFFFNIIYKVLTPVRKFKIFNIKPFRSTKHLIKNINVSEINELLTFIYTNIIDINKKQGGSSDFETTKKK